MEVSNAKPKRKGSHHEGTFEKLDFSQPGIRSWIFVRLMDEEYVINEKKGWIVFYEKKKKEGSTGNEKCFTSGPALLR